MTFEKSPHTNGGFRELSAVVSLELCHVYWPVFICLWFGALPLV